MGRITITLFLAGVLTAQEPQARPAPPAPVMHAEVVLVADRDPVPASAFGLGAGGIDERNAPEPLQWLEDGGCRTPGGVLVQCQLAGVKLTFPSGRELLFAPDGFLHLRSGESAGPYASGAELRLGDGALVRITLNPSQQRRLRDVVVVADERALQPWRRGSAAVETPRLAAWPDVRLVCVGDGGDVFRAIALGPVVVLDRVLVAEERSKVVPNERIALLTAALVQSMERLPRQHTETDAGVRGAVAAIAAVADRSAELFVAGATLRRAERERLRWLLRGGYEIELDVDGSVPRLSLFAGRSPRPMLDWSLGVSPAAFLGNPHAEQPGSKRWHGNGTRLQRVAADLQARDQLFERPLAMAVLRRITAPERPARRR